MVDVSKSGRRTATDNTVMGTAAAGKYGRDGIAEPVLKRQIADQVTVPEGNFFVLGDNRRASNDSRDWGPVPAENVIGRAWVAFWPLNRWHALSLF